MTRQRYTVGRALGPPRLLVMHATAGTWPGDLGWLRLGGGATAVSAHYVIGPAGNIVQLVDEGDTAWHCGPSAAMIDGALRSGSHDGVGVLNHLSIGIELSHTNDPDRPHHAVQLDAATWLAREIMRRHDIPPSQVVRHADIAPGRKTDPAALPWPAWRNGLAAVYTADSPLLGPPLGTTIAAARWLVRSTQYGPAAVAEIVHAYEREGSAAGVDWFLALAQMAHETGSLTSWWCARPRRNPAGIGVTGRVLTAPMELPPDGRWAWRNPESSQHGRWHEGLSFARWDPVAVRAHLGRILAYALPADTGTPYQLDMIDEALGWRTLPANYRGSAVTIADLDGRWAVPGDGYGARVALLAERMRSAAL
jgi:hypothetical protein